MNTPYYVWPCGIYEDLGNKFGWSVIKYRTMPATPMGDVVKTFDCKIDAEYFCESLNALHSKQMMDGGGK